MIYKIKMIQEPITLTFNELLEEEFNMACEGRDEISVKYKRFLVEQMIYNITTNYRFDEECSNLRQKVEEFVEQKLNTPRLRYGDLILVSNVGYDNTLKRFDHLASNHIVTTDGCSWNYAIPLSAYDTDNDANNRAWTLFVKDGELCYLNKN